jgi:hypothetical protein
MVTPKLTIPRGIILDLVLSGTAVAAALAGEDADGLLDETDQARHALRCWELAIDDLDRHLTAEVAGGTTPTHRVISLLSGQMSLSL